MTDRKFTPPTEFPTEYVTSDGRKVVIAVRTPAEECPFVGWYEDKDGKIFNATWTDDGAFAPYWPESTLDLFDPPKKQVHWANDCDTTTSSWYETRSQANRIAGDNRVAVIRREWVEGQPPQYFTEEV
jgi:hypothetical protein